MKVTLPWPPSVNHYWVHVPGGRVALGRAGRQYREDALAAVLEQHGWLTPADYALRVDILAFPPDARTRDLDNTLKAVLDSLHHARVIEDDGLIDDLHIRRGHVSRDHPRVEVTVEQLAP